MIESTKPAGQCEPLVRKLVRNLHLSFDLVRMQQIVRVQPLDVAALRELQCLVSRCRSAGVRLCDDLDTGVFKSTRNSQSIVHRSVVNDDNLRSEERRVGKECKT